MQSSYPPVRVFMFIGGDSEFQQDCIDWATSLLLADLDSQNLAVLAGFSTKSDIYEVREYALKSLKDLSVNTLNETELIDYLVKSFSKEIINDPKLISDNLKILAETYDSLGCFPAALKDFYLLWHAYNELINWDQKHQFYWDGLTKKNCVTEILKYASTRV